MNASHGIVVAVYVVMSVATLVAYRADKQAARRGAWRTEERTLHLMSLLGGWPGALIAQRRYRHKTRKTSFQIAFWLTVVGNTLVLAWILTALI